MFAVTTDKKMAVFHGGDMQRDTPNQQTPPDTYASRVSLILVTRGLLDKPTGGVTNTMDKAPLGALLTDGLGGAVISMHNAGLICRRLFKRRKVSKAHGSKSRRLRRRSSTKR